MNNLKQPTIIFVILGIIIILLLLLVTTRTIEKKDNKKKKKNVLLKLDRDEPIFKSNRTIDNYLGNFNNNYPKNNQLILHTFDEPLQSTFKPHFHADSAPHWSTDLTATHNPMSHSHDTPGPDAHEIDFGESGTHDPSDHHHHLDDDLHHHSPVDNSTPTITHSPEYHSPDLSHGSGGHNGNMPFSGKHSGATKAENSYKCINGGCDQGADLFDIVTMLINNTFKDKKLDTTATPSQQKSNFQAMKDIVYSLQILHDKTCIMIFGARPDPSSCPFSHIPKMGVLDNNPSNLGGSCKHITNISQAREIDVICYWKTSFKIIYKINFICIFLKM